MHEYSILHQYRIRRRYLSHVVAVSNNLSTKTEQYFDDEKRRKRSTRRFVYRETHTERVYTVNDYGAIV